MVGEELEAELPSIGWIRACVAWAKGSRFGLSFAERIEGTRITREGSRGMDPHFELTDRFRPSTSWRRPGLAPRKDRDYETSRGADFRR